MLFHASSRRALLAALEQRRWETNLPYYVHSMVQTGGLLCPSDAPRWRRKGSAHLLEKNSVPQAKRMGEFSRLRRPCWLRYAVEPPWAQSLVVVSRLMGSFTVRWQGQVDQREENPVGAESVDRCYLCTVSVCTEYVEKVCYICTMYGVSSLVLRAPKQSRRIMPCPWLPPGPRLYLVSM